MKQERSMLAASSYLCQCFYFFQYRYRFNHNSHLSSILLVYHSLHWRHHAKPASVFINHEHLLIGDELFGHLIIKDFVDDNDLRRLSSLGLWWSRLAGRVGFFLVDLCTDSSPSVVIRLGLWLTLDVDLVDDIGHHHLIMWGCHVRGDDSLKWSRTLLYLPLDQTPLGRPPHKRNSKDLEIETLSFFDDPVCCVLCVVVVCCMLLCLCHVCVSFGMCNVSFAVLLCVCLSCVCVVFLCVYLIKKHTETINTESLVSGDPNRLATIVVFCGNFPIQHGFGGNLMTDDLT